MKKRRELDALVNGSKQPSQSGARVKNGRHELLRNESESSEIEEFSLTQNTAARKRTRCHCCSMCWPVCSAFLLVLCISFVAVLVWMNIQLKSEVYQLQNRLHEVQVTVKDIPSRVDSLNQEQQSLKKSLDLTIQGDGDVPKLRTAVHALSLQVSTLNSTLITLKQSPAMVSQTTIQELQSHYNQLSHNFADIGSRVAAVEEQRKLLQKQVDSIVSSLTSTTPSPSSRSSQNLSSAARLSMSQAEEEIRRISDELGNMNSTLRGQLDRLMAETSVRQSLLANLYNQTSTLESRLAVLQQPSTVPMHGGLPPAIHAAITNAVNAQVTSRLQEANQADVNVSQSTAVEDMKQRLSARILAFELLAANQTRDIASVAAELNFIKAALNQATSNITDSVQLLAQTTESIAVRLQAVEDTIGDLRSQILKSVPSFSATATSRPAAKPADVTSEMFAGKIATSRPVHVKPDDTGQHVLPPINSHRRRPPLLQDSRKHTIRKDENHHIE